MRLTLQISIALTLPLLLPILDKNATADILNERQPCHAEQTTAGGWCETGKKTAESRAWVNSVGGTTTI